MICLDYKLSFGYSLLLYMAGRGGAKDNGSDYDNGRETAGLYWSGPVFVDPDHELWVCNTSHELLEDI